MRCKHAVAVTRLAAAMTLVEFEYEGAQGRPEQRMIVEVHPVLIRTLGKERTMHGLLTRRGMPLPAIVTAASLASCSATKEAASPWIMAPIGEWQTRIARSDTAETGNNYLLETVQLRRGSKGEPVSVPTLAENNGPAKLLLSWHNAAHLAISYGNAEVLFQAVKLGEVTIETRELFQ